MRKGESPMSMTVLAGAWTRSAGIAGSRLPRCASRQGLQAPRQRLRTAALKAAPREEPVRWLSVEGGGYGRKTRVQSTRGGQEASSHWVAAAAVPC